MYDFIIYTCMILGTTKKQPPTVRKTAKQPSAQEGKFQSHMF